MRYINEEWEKMAKEFEEERKSKVSQEISIMEFIGVEEC